MKCAWKELLSILPPHLRPIVDKYAPEIVQEIRLRMNRLPELLMNGRKISVGPPTSSEELSFVVNSASRYSPWLAATSASGYISAPGGHRIGICGEAVVKDGQMSGFRMIRSLNIRIARDFPGISGEVGNESGSVLIIGKPGCGKTTLLRDVIRRRSLRESVAVVDERCELFPIHAFYEKDHSIDILSCCPKNQGILNLLKTMGPDVIAVDEITAEADCDALLQAGWCGVKLLATAHASDKSDLYSRPIYIPLLKKGLFDTLVIIQPDKSWRMERIRL